MMSESTTSMKNVSLIGLTEDDRENLLKLGALGWGEKDIAVYFGWDKELFHLEYTNPDSEISLLLLRGRLQERAKVEMRLLSDAQGGNLTAVKELSAVMRDNSFQLSKLDLFGGPNDEGAIERIQSYIEGGCKTDLSRNEQIYIDLLVMIYSIDGQYGKRNTIRLLTRKPFGFTYERAANLYAEAVEMFFSSRQVSKDALRAKLADQLDTLHAAAINSARTTKDYEIAANILYQKAKVLRLDQQDPEVLPPTQYARQYRLLSLNPESIGLPPANRDALAAQIALLGLSDSVSKRLRMEASIDDVDIVEHLHYVVQEES